MFTSRAAVPASGAVRPNVEHHRVPREPQHAVAEHERQGAAAGKRSAVPQREEPERGRATSSRAKAIAPGESTSPTERITTKAQAQSSTVISAAAAARCLLDMSATMPRLRRKHNR